MLLVLVLARPSAIRRSRRLAGDEADPSSLTMVELEEKGDIGLVDMLFIRE